MFLGCSYLLIRRRQRQRQHVPGELGCILSSKRGFVGLFLPAENEEEGRTGMQLGPFVNKETNSFKETIAIAMK